LFLYCISKAVSVLIEIDKQSKNVLVLSISPRILKYCTVEVKMKAIDNVKDVIVEKLLRLVRQFGSARDLVEAIEQFGLFNGKVQYYEDGWSYRPFDIGEYPHTDASAHEGMFFPYFACFLFNQAWFCQLGYGTHWLQLGFDIQNGELVYVKADDIESHRCWQSNSYGNREIAIKKLLQ
jgi:hypothetical protein